MSNNNGDIVNLNKRIDAVQETITDHIMIQNEINRGMLDTIKQINEVLKALTNAIEVKTTW